VTVTGAIYDNEGNLCTEATCIYFLFSREKSKAEMGLKECLCEGEQSDEL
jgi:hypothetical protein